MLKKYWKVIAATAAIVIVSYLISTYFVQVMMIQGDSMYPALKNMHFALIDKRATDYAAGDVIVFRSARLKSVLVKRIVGIPGDSVRIEDGKLYVNGEESPLYKDEEIEYPGLLSSETLLNEDEYAVLGDNLAESKDTRYEEVGLIKTGDISGRVIM